MSLLHAHDRHHHGPGEGHHHHHHAPAGERVALVPAAIRYAIAAAIALVAVVAACLVLVGPAEGVVVTRFGDPVRVLAHPGLAWRLPAPIESTTRVDLRLRTTSSGLQDVGTRDGLRVLVQAYIAWQVPDDPQHIRQFLRAVRNQPDEAAEQLRSFTRSALEITASGFDLAQLVNTDPAKVQLAQFEQRLAERLRDQVLSTYGITVRQVGIESLTLPSETLVATVARMRAERQTVATERMAEGERIAAEIRSNADRDARVAVAKAQTEAAETEAKSRQQAAEIYARAYAADPSLYSLLRSFDTLDAVIGPNTRLILRTDAAPFRAFVDGPTKPGNEPANLSGVAHAAGPGAGTTP
ncbi:MAG: protease modulator HflC [Alphaproteobacteria bacterium]|nr:protease modulator HflC [Alphaproteobacteria bacterium]